MESDAPRRGSSAFDRWSLGERLGGFIYGTILVLSVIVAGAKTFPHGAGRLALFVLVTTLVFWLAHVYAHAVGSSIGQNTHLSLARLRHTAHQEASILGAGVPPEAALLLATIGVISAHTAVWLALALGLVLLFALGIAFARMERLGFLGTLFAVLANLAFGSALIVLKVAVTH